MRHRDAGRLDAIERTQDIELAANIRRGGVAKSEDFDFHVWVMLHTYGQGVDACFALTRKR